MTKPHLVEITYRDAHPGDGAAISQLISTLAKDFIVGAFPEEGKRAMLGAVSEEAIAGYLAEEEFDYQVAEHEGDIVGVVAIRGLSHLYHLFVKESYQGIGLSRALWDLGRNRSIKRGHQGNFTVNSSTNSQHVYISFGFTPDGEADVRNGVTSHPMTLHQPT